MEEGAGSAPNCLTFHEAVDPDSPTGASTDDKLSPGRGRRYPEVTQHLVQVILSSFLFRVLSPGSSELRKELNGQWKGGTSQVLCWTGGHTAQGELS